jgi:SLT domain-containing protein
MCRQAAVAHLVGGNLWRRFGAAKQGSGSPLSEQREHTSGGSHSKAQYNVEQPTSGGCDTIQDTTNITQAPEDVKKKETFLRKNFRKKDLLKFL